MSASNAIGFERLEALLGGAAPRTPDEARRAAAIAQLRAATLNAPETLRSRVLAVAPSSNRSFSPRRSRRLVFAVVPAAFALALPAAILAGLTTGNGARP